MTERAVGSGAGRVSRRVLLGGVAAGVAGLTGCSGRHHEDERTIELRDRFGSLRAPVEPQRIVALGFGRDADTLTALGRVPIAVQRVSRRPSGFDPWLEGALGNQRPRLLDAAIEPPLEAIAALRPDLIVATSYYPLERYHQLLTGIAPVLGPAQGPNVDDWRTTTTRLGQAVGRSVAATALIDRLEQQLAAARRSYSALRGRTYTFSSFSTAGEVSVKRDEQDVLASALADFELRLSPTVAALPGKGVPGFGKLGYERLELLDADLVMVVYHNEAERREIEARPAVRRALAGFRGRYVPLGEEEAHSLAFPSVLTLPYVIRKILPRLRWPST